MSESRRRIDGQYRKTHGMGGSPTYCSWYTMLLRCNDPRHDAWRYYGARGITVCERWLTFENFMADMGIRPEGRTLDRIDGNGNYEPGNCQWATWEQQQLNRRHVKCSHDMADAIRREYRTGLSQSKIGQAYGLSQGVISKIVRNVAWVQKQEAA